MSEFLDELARSVARPMPRSRALRVLGGALVSIAVPGLAPKRAAAAPLKGCDPKACGTNKVCGIPLLEGCTLACCSARFPVCCKFMGVDRFNPVGAGGYCSAHAAISGPKPEPARLVCCCPKNSVCGAPPAGPPCVCRTPCGNKCCNEDLNEFCASKKLSLCCKEGDRICRGGGKLWCCDKSQECNKEKQDCRCSEDKPVECEDHCCAKGDTCCPPDRKGYRECCPPKKFRCCTGCCPNDWPCVVVGGKPKCCAPDLYARAFKYCCPEDASVPTPSGCCPSKEDCCKGVAPKPGMICVNGKLVKR